jgi:hypothetical protein
MRRPRPSSRFYGAIQTIHSICPPLHALPTRVSSRRLPSAPLEGWLRVDTPVAGGLGDALNGNRVGAETQRH